MNVLQVNVRLREGGAARMALDLHRQLHSFGVNGRFAYGWGERGGRSLYEASVPGSFQVGAKVQVIGNMLVHRLVGLDCLLPPSCQKLEIQSAIRAADIIHLHAIHSHFLPFEWLINELTEVRKPVVFTAHDYWLLTGRCAFTEGCDAWKRGCGDCPSGTNYPAAFFDLSASEFIKRRAHIKRLGSLLHIVTPSNFLAEAFFEAMPSVNLSVIPNWIDGEFENAISSSILSSENITIALKDKISIVVTANDLSDPTKVDRNAITELIEMKHVEVKTIGKNSPFHGSNVTNYGSILDRSKMVALYSSSDLALFTSEKDTFGLVMIEALACGVPVLAVESLAAREVLSRMSLQPVKNTAELLQHVRDRTLPRCYFANSAKTLSESALKIYTAKTSVMKYLSLYKSLL